MSIILHTFEHYSIKFPPALRIVPPSPNCRQLPWTPHGVDNQLIANWTPHGVDNQLIASLWPVDSSCYSIAN